MAESASSPVETKDYAMLRGIPWPPMVTDEALDAIQALQVRDDDILIATFPKSGTNWLSEICRLIIANGDVNQINRSQLGNPLEFATDPGENRPDTVSNPDCRPLFERVDDWTSPRVLITHVPVQHLPEQVLTQCKGKIVTSIRNPKDSAVSEYHFLKMIRPGAPLTFADSLEENYFSNKGPYGSWFDHVLGYWRKRHEKNHLVIKYEDMKMDTPGAIIRIADFLGLPLSDGTIDKIVDLVTIESMKKRFYSVGEKPGKDKAGPLHLLRKGVVGDWKTQWTVAQNEAFDKLYRGKMAGSGLMIDFE